MTRVKICGVTSVGDAQACVDAGVDAIGVNFVSSSVRCVDVGTARAIATAIGARALIVGVVADMPVADMRSLREATGVGCLQLHGNEPPSDVEKLLPHAYKAIRVASVDDIARAREMPGDYVLADAKVDGFWGGTGRVFDWSLVVDLARDRRLVLAGGLTPENVGRAVQEVRPWCVDVASGVEREPRVKDPAKIRAFVAAVRAAGT